MPKRETAKITHDQDVGCLRIARAGQAIFDQARRSLPEGERAGQRQRAGDWALPEYQDTVGSLAAREMVALIEVTDGADVPLAYMPSKAVFAQGLYHRIVTVALRTHKNTLLLHRHREGRWGLYSDVVLAGEARKDAALRILRDRVGVDEQKPVLLAAEKALGQQIAHWVLFVVELPAGVYPRISQRVEKEKESRALNRAWRIPAAGRDVLEVDADELEGLLAQTPELLTQELARAAGRKGLFSRERPQ